LADDKREIVSLFSKEKHIVDTSESDDEMLSKNMISVNEVKLIL
jgi:hypothetical protein